MTRQNSVLAAAALAVLASACASMGGNGGAAKTAAKGEDTATAIKMRQTAMQSIGAASAALRMPNLDQATAQASGKTINANLKIFAEHLPKGSGPESGLPTKAKSTIWTSSDQFNTALNTGLSASQSLAAATGDPAAIQAQARLVMQACGGCHTAYRS
jgi:cytochrome c556